LENPEKLAAAILAHVDDLPDPGAGEQSEEFLGGFSGEADGAEEALHHIRNTRQLRRGTECEILRLEDQGVIQSGITARDEQRSAGDVVEAVEDEEAILGVALRFEEAAAPNMGGCGAAVQERRANHQEAMALQGIFFSAHEGNDVGPGEARARSIPSAKSGARRRAV